MSEDTWFILFNLWCAAAMLTPRGETWRWMACMVLAIGATAMHWLDL